MKHLVCLSSLLIALPLGAAPPRNDYPTIDRVLYVQECVRDHPGPTFEMTNKCACALDALARQVPHKQYVSMSTSANAHGIGGERGAYIRDTDLLQKEIKRFRELQSKVKKGCFIDVEAK